MEEVKKLTGQELENRIQEEAQKIARQVFYFECSDTVAALLRDAEKNWKEAVISPDDFYSGCSCCPECGSSDYEENDDDETDETDDDEKETGYYRCNDCGAVFDDPDYSEVSQYWFFDRNYIDDFKEYGARVVETEDCPIWLRYGCNYGFELEGVFRFIAKRRLRLFGLMD